MREPIKRAVWIFHDYRYTVPGDVASKCHVYRLDLYSNGYYMESVHRDTIAECIEYIKEHFAVGHLASIEDFAAWNETNGPKYEESEGWHK